MWANTVWLFANATWNMVPGNTEVIVPSISIVLSWLIVEMRETEMAFQGSGPDACSSRKGTGWSCAGTPLRTWDTQQNHPHTSVFASLNLAYPRSKAMLRF